jgi:hypothetical protein
MMSLAVFPLRNPLALGLFLLGSCSASRLRGIDWIKEQVIIVDDGPLIYLVSFGTAAGLKPLQ